LHESVGSALAQTDVDVRVLVIDDASDDDSADVARSIAESDPRVEVHVHPQNRGHIATYNEGLLEWCDTDYVALLSADDVLTPGALSRAAALLDANPAVGLAYGRPVRFVDGQDRLPARTKGTGWRIYDGQRWLARRFRKADGCITSPEVVVRTEVQRKIGGYRADLPHSGDIEMWMRFAAVGDIGYLRGVDQAYYRVHASNMSGAYVGGAGLADLLQRRAAYAAVLAEFGSQIDDRVRLETAVRRKLAAEALYRASRAMDRHREQPVDDLVAFAEQTYPRARRMPGYAGLRLRRAIGSRATRTLQLSGPSAVARRARRAVTVATWKRRGI
jgi:hypothetical protein